MRARSIPYLVHNRAEKLRLLLLGTLLFLGPDLGSTQMTEFTNVPRSRGTFPTGLPEINA